MTDVVHLKWGERPPEESFYLVVTRQGRIRGEDYYVGASRELEGEDRVLATAGPGYPSLASALFQAECVAARNGVSTIYVKLAGRAAEAFRA